VIRVENYPDQWRHPSAGKFFVVDFRINKFGTEITEQKQANQYQTEPVDIPGLFCPFVKVGNPAIQDKDHGKKNDSDKNLVNRLKNHRRVHHRSAPPCL